MTPAYCQPINFIKVYKFAIFLAQDQNRSAYGAARMKGGYSLSEKENIPLCRVPTRCGENPKKYHFLNFLIVSAMIFCFKIMLTST